MKNVTITLPDEVARAARVEAAKAGKSLSRYVSDLVAEAQHPAPNPQREAFEAWISGPTWQIAEGGRLPSREELYAERIDELVRRHQRPDLQSGSE